MAFVGVIAPMPSELRPFVQGAGLERSGDRFVGVVGEHRVVAVTCGVGMERAARTAEQLVANDRVHRVIVIDGASGAEYRPDHWGPGEPQGRIATFDEFEAEMEVMGDLQREGVTAVDMETAAVLQMCDARGVPCSVFRAISDDATDGSVDAATAAMLHPDGTPDVNAALRYMLRRPWRIPRLVRLGLDSRRAARAAAEAVTATLRG